MIKGFSVQKNDICISTFMVCVAAFAGATVNQFALSVITFFLFQVERYFFVTIYAQIGLICLAERFMAFIAVVFIFCVALN